MPKAKTLRERAEHRADRDYDMVEDREAFVTGYLAGHRANRLTKAERAVVEAAAESSNALESIIVGLVERLGAGDPVVQMLDNLVKAPIDAALSNLDQEARKDG
jgi:hypothetical protein